MRGWWLSLGCSGYSYEVNESSTKQISLVFQVGVYSTPHRGVAVGGWRQSLGCSCLYEYEVNESSIKQTSLVFQFDVYSTPHRDVTVRGWWPSLGCSCLYPYEVSESSVKPISLVQSSLV